MSEQTRGPLENAEAGSAWIDALLELFWAVDAAVQLLGQELPEHVQKVYERAEAARQEL